QDHHPHRVERGVLERGEDLRPGRENVLAGLLLRTQEARQRLHLGALQIVAHAPLLAASRSACACPRRCAATRNWNSSLVTSSFSSTGFSTRSLAPARISAAWLAGFSSPVITSTGRRPLS